MKFPPIDHKLTGVVVPVFSLRSSKSCGIGEFSDLPLLAQWCKNSDLEIIQILPVNDTGYQESPYSALSAFALHPIFIRLELIKESKPHLNEIKELREKYEASKRLQFADVLTSKLNILQKIYKKNLENIKNDKTLENWMKKNLWVKNYALFSTIRKMNLLTTWKNWIEYRDPTEKELKELWPKFFDENYFHVWVQYHLEKQLIKAAKDLDTLGIRLKGDIPILMNEDSCDVWSNREFFNLDLSAGAPPDMFSLDGQNWGFPIYNWENLKKDDYSWWRKRLKQAAKFYHAYRIDHVLGFFRIWNIPFNMVTGSMGYFNPSSFINKQDLFEMGFDENRIKWLSNAHVPEQELREHLGSESESIIKTCLDRVGDENLFLFNENFNSEKAIYNSNISEKSKAVLADFLKNETLIKIDAETFSFSWTFRNTRGYNSLNQWEKEKVEELSARVSGQSEKIWEENALELLSFMKDTTDMLVCAEDLGAVPDCVPSVLNQLGILGLKVVRWARDWELDGDPYTPIQDYPLLSVCTPAVHDSTTLKQWWYEEKDKNALARGMNVPGFDEFPSESAIEFFLKSLLMSNSAICMLQIQDLFALDNSVCDNDIHFERINIPGTVQDINWSYRITPELETLLENRTLSGKIAQMTSIRKSIKINL
ncbi:MAG: 4-alpha-glucanotransferase [Spirochaetaceae bacterium]|jgi:4-alpha-glucanotransferase|nr:4-alpha-glucanotransferase [Spirochaetaceae bacterium]